jgi:hypothetical protein
MRPDAPTPAAAVVDLLQRAEALATAAATAIESDDDGLLATLLDERDAVIAAIGEAWKTVSPRALTPDLLGRVTRAMQTTQAAGAQAHAAAMRVRAQVVSALSALDARQSATFEYLNGSPNGSIDVVL